jgi:hypothetical protein
MRQPERWTPPAFCRRHAPSTLRVPLPRKRGRTPSGGLSTADVRKVSRGAGSATRQGVLWLQSAQRHDRGLAMRRLVSVQAKPAARILSFALKFAYAVTIADAAYTFGYFLEIFYKYTLRWGLPTEKVANLPLMYLYQWPAILILALPLSLGAYLLQRRYKVRSAYMFALVGAVIGLFCALEAFVTVLQWMPHEPNSPNLEAFLDSSGVLSLLSGASGGWTFWSVANAFQTRENDLILPSA